MGKIKVIVVVTITAVAIIAGYFIGQTQEQKQPVREERDTTPSHEAVADQNPLTAEAIITNDEVVLNENASNIEPIITQGEVVTHENKSIAATIITQDDAKDFSDPNVELRNRNGQTIQAELLNLNGNLLTIRRDDNQEFSFDIGMLVEADRQYVLKHFEERPPTLEPKPEQQSLKQAREYVIPTSIQYLDTLYEEILEDEQ